MGPLLQSTRSVVLCVRTTTAYKQAPLLIQLPNPVLFVLLLSLATTIAVLCFLPFSIIQDSDHSGIPSMHPLVPGGWKSNVPD